MTRRNPRGTGISPAPGLRLLVDLINDALAGMVAAPAAVGPNGPLVARRAAVDAVAVPRTGRLRGRSRSGPPEESPEQSPEDRVDDAHAETWQLVEAARTGDGEAFGRLYDRYVDTVFKFIYYRVNDRQLAEDFTSETFLRALRRIGSVSYQGRDIGAWFITIARNIVFDHMKSARHRLEVTTADTIEGREHGPSTESAVLDTLQAERLMAAVGELGEEQRECVMLRFIQGLSVSETAAVMGKNDGAIKALQHRAVRKLAEKVGGELR
jgi:RNA polymerase sigma-70 factor, ECF subfamily